MKRLLMLLLLAALWVTPHLWAASSVITTNGSSCTPSTNCLVVNLPQDKGGATLTLSGTWTGTITFEASGDGGNTWTAVLVTPLGSSTQVSSVTANGTWQVNTAGFTGLRMRASAAVTGSATATITPSAASARNGGAGSAGSGTVTAFTATGTTTPLFTYAVTNGTTTPNLAFTLSSFAADGILINATGGSAVPTVVALPDTGSNALGYTAHGFTTVSGGGISGLTTGYIPKAASATSIANSALDDGITTTGTLTYTGVEGAQFSGQVAIGVAPSGAYHNSAFFSVNEGSATTPSAASVDLCQSTPGWGHSLFCSWNHDDGPLHSKGYPIVLGPEDAPTAGIVPIWVAPGVGGAKLAKTSEISDTGGTGGVVIGSATGGQQGNGTLNAAGLYVNGAAVATGATIANTTLLIKGDGAGNGVAGTPTALLSTYGALIGTCAQGNIGGSVGTISLAGCSVITATLTSNVTSWAFSNGNLTTYTIKLTQDGTGGRTVAGPTGVNNFPAIVPDANKTTEFMMTCTTATSCDVIPSVNNAGFNWGQATTACADNPASGYYCNGVDSAQNSGAGWPYGFVHGASAIRWTYPIAETATGSNSAAGKCSSGYVAVGYDQAGEPDCVANAGLPSTWSTNATTTITAGTTSIFDTHAMNATTQFLFPGAATTGLVRVTTSTGAFGSAELSGFAVTSGSNVVTPGHVVSGQTLTIDSGGTLTCAGGSTCPSSGGNTYNGSGLSGPTITNLVPGLTGTVQYVPALTTGTAASSGNEALAQQGVGVVATGAHLCVVMPSFAASGGTITIALRANAANPTSGPTVTISAATTTTPVCDNTDSYTTAANDLLDFSITTTGTVATGGYVGISMQWGTGGITGSGVNSTIATWNSSTGLTHSTLSMPVEFTVTNPTTAAYNTFPASNPDFNSPFFEHIVEGRKFCTFTYSLASANSSSANIGCGASNNALGTGTATSPTSGLPAYVSFAGVTSGTVGAWYTNGAQNSVYDFITNRTHGLSLTARAGISATATTRVGISILHLSDSSSANFTTDSNQPFKGDSVSAIAHATLMFSSSQATGTCDNTHWCLITSNGSAANNITTAVTATAGHVYTLILYEDTAGTGCSSSTPCFCASVADNTPATGSFTTVCSSTDVPAANTTVNMEAAYEGNTSSSGAIIFNQLEFRGDQ